MANKLHRTTKKKAAAHDVTMPLLNAMFKEFKELARKKPEAVLSKNKLTIANRLLARIREILETDESMEFLDLLNEDDIPQVSDVTLILSQYVAGMIEFKAKHFGEDDDTGEYGWLAK